MSAKQLNLLAFNKPEIRTLHLTWFAFFISFMVWFAHAPLMVVIRESMHLTEQEVKILLILNVALTIPARIVVGMLVDKYGPRQMFSSILILGGLISIGFAFTQTYQQLAIVRFLLGFVGAGFVVGIRMISEWFPARQTGVAQGIYGGWGNFGSAGAAILLPSIALYFGAENGWRYAIGSTGVLAIVYGCIYYFSVSNTPKGATYFKPKKMGAMEVTSKTDLVLYILMNIPMYLALSVLTWKLSAKMQWIDPVVSYAIYATLIVLYLYQVKKIIQLNQAIFHTETPEVQRYAFKQIAILDLAYMLTFGAELAVCSMLPLYYVDTFNVEPILAGILAGIYPFINLFARPAGGWLSDKFGRKLTLSIVTSGAAISFFILSNVSTEWALWAVVAVTILCGIFSKAGSGAVYAMVPLIQRRMTGQFAGMVGAFGNVGGLAFLTVLSFVDTNIFFMTIAATAVFVFLMILIFLNEPSGSMFEVLEDGTVEMINVK
ncbi:MAG: NarK family nitrate/nitrite MFS transporter [Methylococcales symbiont of Iophon sp. n. MRB-2018]|nr:MAG: NarK family nitrate/nitrite MFS transporter [Methylococcales symbiont of Iophon sp. n. MRB-2018]KAF3979400.1 MAG: NarK family nitrate/nitrite MFS transporter [Methylococcales symbiont of Iophon sp. n. MRB-2018]